MIPPDQNRVDRVLIRYPVPGVRMTRANRGNLRSVAGENPRTGETRWARIRPGVDVTAGLGQWCAGQQEPRVV